MVGSLVLISFVGLYFAIAKNTPLEISVRRRKLTGLLYFIGLFFYVLVGSLFYYNNVFNEYLHTFFVTSENTQLTSYWIWYGVFTFIIVFSYLTKHKYQLKIDINAFARDERELNLLFNVSIICSISVILLFYAYGMRNAMMAAILTGDNIITIRLQNIASDIPTLVISYFIFLLHFNGILFGAIYERIPRFRKILCIIFLIYTISWLGDKSLYLYIFLEFYISRLIFINNSKSSRRPDGYIRIGILGLSLFGVFLFVAQLQVGYDNLGGAIRYIISRGVLGQIQGVYEEFGLGLHDVAYALTALPFGSLFTGHQYFNKDLMMATWGAGLSDPSQTGVMNSFFIGEAFAIGGYVLVALSPFIVAFAFLIGHSAFAATLHRLFGISRVVSRNLAVLVVASTYWLTADIGGYIFLKLTIMQLLFLVTMFLAKQLLSMRHRQAPESEKAIFVS